LSILLVIVLFGLGVALVIKGGDLFVTTSVSIAAHARVPKILIGGTLVSLATTGPELAVSLTASLRGNPGLAIGNAVGSAICNVGLILGVLCVLHPMDVRPREFRLPAAAMMLGGVLLACLTVGLKLGRTSGAVLLAYAGIYLVTDFVRQKREADKLGDHGLSPEEAPKLTLRKSIWLFIVGAGLVIVGSRLLADSGVVIAKALGVPPMIVGLTLVAMGTSLPELVTAIHAARIGVPELSLGNVVGANIMNVTLIAGGSAAIHPLQLTRATQLYNFPAMLVIFGALVWLSYTEQRLTRNEGWLLLSLYGLYIAGLFVLRG
jgi:cation:H+ antiporter